MAVTITTETLIQNWMLIVGAALTMVLAFWFFDERDQSDSVGRTIMKTSERAESALGGLLTGTRALLLAILGIIGTAAAETMQFAADVNGVLDSMPLLLGHLAYGIVSLFGVEIGIPRERLGVIFLGVTVIAVLWGAAYNRRTESLS